MRFRLFAILFAVVMPLTAQAQQIIDSYYAVIGPQDRYNSSGALLGSMGAILQQDRANLHRFGRGDIDDDYDRYFSDAGVRSQIPALYAAGRQDQIIEQTVLRGPGLRIVVFLCGNNGVISYLTVDYANGDGHRAC